MKVKREWNDVPPVFEAVAEALSVMDVSEYLNEPAAVFASEERGEYGENGTLVVEIAGHRFSIELHELV